MTKTTTSGDEIPKKTPVKKASAKKAAASKAKTASKAAGDVGAKKAKAHAAKTSKPEADKRIVAMHGETRVTHAGEPDADRIVEAIGRLVDEVHALNKVRITSAVHIGTTTTIHVVLPDHSLPYDIHPGIILEITANNLVSFDQVAIGLDSPDLINDAAHALLLAIRGDADSPANLVGRRADWYEQAVIAAEDVAGKYATA